MDKMIDPAIKNDLFRLINDWIASYDNIFDIDNTSKSLISAFMSDAAYSVLLAILTLNRFGLLKNGK